MQCRHIIITTPPTHWGITFRNLPFQKTGRLAAHLMPHEVHTILRIRTTASVLELKSILIALSLLGNVCSSFSIWTCRQPQNGRFWLSAGLEYLPSGISGLAAAAATLPTVDWDSFSTSSRQSIISRWWQRTTFPHQQTKPNPKQFMDFYNLWKSYQTWLAGPPVTSGGMPRQAPPSSSLQVQRCVWVRGVLFLLILHLLPFFIVLWQTKQNIERRRKRR